MQKCRPTVRAWLLRQSEVSHRGDVLIQWREEGHAGDPQYGWSRDSLLPQQHRHPAVEEHLHLRFRPDRRGVVGRKQDPAVPDIWHEAIRADPRGSTGMQLPF